MAHPDFFVSSSVRNSALRVREVGVNDSTRSDVIWHSAR